MLSSSISRARRWCRRCRRTPPSGIVVHSANERTSAGSASSRRWLTRVDPASVIGGSSQGEAGRKHAADAETLGGSAAGDFLRGASVRSFNEGVRRLPALLCRRSTDHQSMLGCGHESELHPQPAKEAGTALRPREADLRRPRRLLSVARERQTVKSGSCDGRVRGPSPRGRCTRASGAGERLRNIVHDTGKGLPTQPFKLVSISICTVNERPLRTMHLRGPLAYVVQPADPRLS